jgi:hypothetical protein
MATMPPPPKQLHGANVLLWTTDLKAARPTARTTHRVGGSVLGPAAALAICQYGGDSQYYLFYCDDDWTVRTDTCHASLAEAKQQAEFEYEGVTALWQPLL